MLTTCPGLHSTQGVWDAFYCAYDVIGTIKCMLMMTILMMEFGKPGPPVAHTTATQVVA